MLGRKTRRTDSDTISVQVPITPMLDMAFQLMAFFVFTFRPSTSEGQITMQLPEIKGGGAAISASLEQELDPKTVYRATIRGQGGLIESITLNRADAVAGSGGTSFRASEPGDPVEQAARGVGPVAELAAELAKIAPEGAPEDQIPALEVVAEPSLVYRQVVAILDACLRRNITDVRMMELVEN